MTNSRYIESLLSSIQTTNESREIEYKEALNAIPKSFWETYSSFSNTAGGVIFLGVSENKSHKVTGVNAPGKLRQDLFNTANNPDKVSRCVLTDDDVREHKIDGKIVISVKIRELSMNQKPLYLNGNPLCTYIRKNEADYRASLEDLKRFIRNSGENNDAELLDDYRLDDLNRESVLAFKNIMHHRKPNRQFMAMGDLEFLTEMGVFRLDINGERKLKLTLAGLLFLGKFDAILQKIPHFHLDYINRRGESATRWRDRVSTGDLEYPDLNLFEFYRIVREKLRLTVEDKFELDERSVRKPSSELDRALREALANMIIHADYLDPETSVQVTADNLHYTFLNPGIMKISENEFFLGGQSKPRNNTLIQYFRNMGESERAGTGGKEIIDIVSKNKYRMPELFTDLRSTKLILWSATPADSYEDLSDVARKVLDFINKKNHATRTEIKQNCALSDHYVRKAIDELLQKKLISFSGKGRSIRYWWAPSMVETINFANELTESIRKIPPLKKTQKSSD